MIDFLSATDHAGSRSGHFRGRGFVEISGKDGSRVVNRGINRAFSAFRVNAADGRRLSGSHRRKQSPAPSDEGFRPDRRGRQRGGGSGGGRRVGEGKTGAEKRTADGRRSAVVGTTEESHGGNGRKGAVVGTTEESRGRNDGGGGG